MDKSKINKERMYHSTDLVLDKFNKEFSGFEEIVDLHQQLKMNLALIGNEQQVQVTDNTGLTQTKVTIRTTVTPLLLKINSALKAVATTQKDQDLFQKANYQLNDLNRLPDPIFYDVATMIYNLAVSMNGQISRFFVTDEDLSNCGTTLASFKTAMPQKRLATTVSKSSTTKISDVFKATDKMLKEQLDIYLAPFQFPFPDFYREYCNARIIVGYTGRKGKKAPDTDPKTDPSVA